MARVKQTVKQTRTTKTRYRKSKSSKSNGRRRCNSCGRFM